MPTTTLQFSGIGGRPPFSEWDTQRFVTTGTTPQFFEFLADSATLSPVPIMRFFEVVWMASGGSPSAGKAICAFRDDGSNVSIVGSSQLLAAGTSTLSVSIVGVRTITFEFVGPAATTLNWTVLFREMTDIYS